MKPRAILLGAVAIALGCGGCGKREESLSLLVWEGYADESAVHDFEQSHHCKVSASYMGSSDELVAKLRGGSASNYDVISPSSDVAASIARAGLAAPLNLSKIPSYSQLSNKLRDLPLVKPGGQVYGVPFMWGPNPRSEEHTSELQSRFDLVCRLLLEKKKARTPPGTVLPVTARHADVVLIIAQAA